MDRDTEKALGSLGLALATMVVLVFVGPFIAYYHGYVWLQVYNIFLADIYPLTLFHAVGISYLTTLLFLGLHYICNKAQPKETDTIDKVVTALFYIAIAPLIGWLVATLFAWYFM